jgi:hypothetical protein
LRMMRSLSIIFFIVITSQFAFGQKRPPILFPPPVLEFAFTSACELPNHKNELVYTRLIYDSNGNLHPEEKSCKNIIANLYLPNNIFLNPKYIRDFKAVSSQKKKNNLIIDAIGVFEDDVSGVEHGIGDLGDNKYRFILKTVVDIQQTNPGK